MPHATTQIPYSLSLTAPGGWHGTFTAAVRTIAADLLRDGAIEVALDVDLDADLPGVAMADHVEARVGRIVGTLVLLTDVGGVTTLILDRVEGTYDTLAVPIDEAVNGFHVP